MKNIESWSDEEREWFMESRAKHLLLQKWAIEQTEALRLKGVRDTITELYGRNCPACIVFKHECFKCPFGDKQGSILGCVPRFIKKTPEEWK